ncbi:MAG: bifunctional DNA-formamidopyrimidine glycosylase/DNA-(apurinic or apyrimidinic site) lyase [bacterium]
MPELPEVETIKRELKPRLIHKKIKKCTVLRNDIIAYPDPKEFCKSITNESIIDVSRKAKYLFLELTNDKKIIFHLRLSGTISLRKARVKPERFTRVIISINGHQLFFNEPRALGRIYLVKGNRKLPMLKGLYNLGIEPTADSFNFSYMNGKLKGRKAKIKSLLLDQSICAGVGNIYSDEALFKAGVRPLRRAYRMTIKETARLVKALKDVIRKGIDNYGTSVADYHRTDGKDGSFQNFLNVYGKENEPCNVCGTKIVLKKLGNRSTRYCPKCQK